MIYNIGEGADMCKNLKVLCIFLLIYFVVSCEVAINPIFNITSVPDSLDFEYVQVNHKVTQNLHIINNGTQTIQLIKFELEFFSSSTLNDEFKISAGMINQNISLNKNEFHELSIDFKPLNSGAKSVRLNVQYLVDNCASLFNIQISGIGYKGLIQLYPAVLVFKPAYVSEEQKGKFTVINRDSTQLTVKSIEITSFGGNTSYGEFRITSGWDGNFRKLNPGQYFEVWVTFRPLNVNSKTARLTVKIAESHFDFNITLSGLSCETLEFVTDTKLPDAELGKFYFCSFECTGGDGKYSLSVPNSNLPTGLTLNYNILKGTPTVHGDFGFTLVVNDDSGHSAYKTFILHINHAMLYRNSTDVDSNYVFTRNDDTGFYIVNLIAEGDIALTINSISLSGTGYISREARILSQPTLPYVMHNGDKTQIVINVESYLDESRSITLTVNHSGYNTPFSKYFEWDVDSDFSYIFVLDRSGSMSAHFGGGFPVYDVNGNTIPYPNRWQALQSVTAERINALHLSDTFEVITFATQIYICNSTLKTATTGNKAKAIAWVYNQNTTACTNGYDGLKAAFNDYGQVDKIVFMSDGYVNTAISLGCGACTCSSWIGARIFTDARTWVNSQIAMYSNFRFYITQYGGSPVAFMTQLGALPNCSYELK